MKTNDKKIRFPVLTTLLLAGIFVCGSATGMFVYATGSHVIEDVFLKMVSHTEYRYGEQGQIIARLVDFQGNAVVVTSCNATILYPDKSYFANMAGMTASGNITGDHYYSFTTPTGPEGVYEYQATCFYMQGMQVRNQSVTNSFHLSGAFNAILNNQTVQNQYLEGIQGNLTLVQQAIQNVSDELADVNASLSGEIGALSNQLNVNVTMLYNQADANYVALQSQINANVTQILAEFDTITVSVNLTPVLDAIDALELSMAGNFTALSNQINNNFTTTFSYLDAVNITSSNIYSVLLDVNDTTTNTYQYVTGTLTTNVNSILSQLGVINATVNRIETTTNTINATVSTILENQENQVYMSVFSG